MGLTIGAFLLDVLEDDSVDSLKEYTANNLLSFLTKESDRVLMKDSIKKLRNLT